MTKTKDEIWDSFMGKGDFATLSTHQKSLVKGILGEYAKRRAIEFADWIKENRWCFQEHFHDPSNWRYFNHQTEEDKYASTQELFDQFIIESQNK